MSQKDTDTILTAQSDLVNTDLANQPKEVQHYQSSMQLSEFRSFYKPPNEDNFYHVTCKMVCYLQNSENLTPLDDDYDYEFFHQGYYVTCKLITDELIIDILNKELYGINFDANGLRSRHLLTPYRKLHLEQSLKQDILFYLCIPETNGCDSDDQQALATP